MTHRSFLSPSLLGRLTALGVGLLSLDAFAQVPPPPLPPPVGEPSAPAPNTAVAGDRSNTPSDPVAGTAIQRSQQSGHTPLPSDPGSHEASPRPPSEGQGIDDAAPNQMNLSVEEQALPSDPNTEDTEANSAWFRERSLHRQTSLSGSTGLTRVREAGSGAVGTFRFSMTGGYFSTSGFLCTAEASCSGPNGQTQEDSAQRSEAIFGLSVTPFPFLEAFMSLHNSATSNSEGSPERLLVVGDMNLGVKGFMPDSPDQLFTFGGELDLSLLSGTGGVGVAGGATSFALRGLGTMNLNNRTQKSERIPLRAHLNLGYFFDNSGQVVDSLENTPPPEGRGTPIERTERYGLGISRVDAFEIGLGAEYLNPWVRPYLEWTVDIPANRQAYVCNIQGAAERGDGCLGVDASLASSPSRLTLGTRVFPWQATDLALSFALDIGTGGTSRFLEETTPEAPYSLWFGLAYAVDTVPAPPVVVESEASDISAPETRRYIIGSIVESNEGAVVPDAIIRYEGVPMTGLVANAHGEFISQDLPPGEYSFKIFAEQFRQGECRVSIPQNAPPIGAPPEQSGMASGSPLPAYQGESSLSPASSDTLGATETAARAPYAEEDGSIMVPLVCKLQELPRVASITGLLVDALSGGPVADASVTITDKLSRSLKLAVDEKGSFQFRNVPFGEAYLKASAPGYLTSISPLRIESRDSLEPHLLMSPRPKNLSLHIGKKSIKLDRPLQFVGDTSEVAIDSMSMVEELAAALIEQEDLRNVEVQVHSDDTGAASYSRRLSQERANLLKKLLVQLGVSEERLTAKGYGPDQPIAPNVSDTNRALNNRVQITLH